MKRGICLIGILIMAIILVGCENKAIVEPVEGPLAALNTSLEASFTWDGTGTGIITITMPDGEVCRGRYITVMKPPSEFFFSLELYARYFGGTFDPFGMQYGQALLTGTKGKIIKAEYFVSLSNYGYGLAEDNSGNLYKLILGE